MLQARFNHKEITSFCHDTYRCSPKQLKMYEALMEHHRTICDAARDGEVCVSVW
jgi:hypothetical protein